MNNLSLILAWFSLSCLSISAADATAQKESKPPAQTSDTQRAPTHANVSYGSHERQVLDFYQAPSDKPTPVVFHIHGGGWVAGDKKGVAGLENYLAAGISVVSINYRYSTQAQLAGVKPPVDWPLHDAAHALQFVRSKATDWNIDKQRIGATGGSAGACSSLWLAFHNDMADPNSADPLARESTRLWCAAVLGAQTSLDPRELKEWTPNSRYGGHAFGFMPDPNDNKTRDTQFAEFLAARESLLPWIKEYSPIEHVTLDDPPVWLSYTDPPALGLPQKDPTHTANYGVKLQEKCKAIGTQCELVYPGAPAIMHSTAQDYLIKTLKQNVHRNLAYVDSGNPRQKLDIYAPDSARHLPVVFWIHGGGWQGGDRLSIQFKPEAFVDKGLVFVSTGYRLLPEVEMVEIFRDIAKSLDWVHDHIAEYGGDPNRILVMGHSAGAQLAALISIDDRYLKAEGLSLSMIKGCVPVDGDTYDVPAIIETAETRRRVHGQPQAKLGHREKFGNDPAKHRDYSAVTHVAKDKGIPPFLILHVADHPDTTAQAERLTAVLKENGIPVKRFPAKDTHHSLLNENLGLLGDPPTKALFDFVDEALKR